MIPEYQRLDAELYDSYIEMAEDIPFYVETARSTGGPVLELGCGTGRILIPTAEAGIAVTGLDLSRDMLNIARKRVAALNPEIRSKVSLVEGDMRSFHLDQTFRLITVPFRAFLHLLTVDDQRQALRGIHEHLVDEGLLVFNIFDPNLNMIADHSSYTGQAFMLEKTFKHPITGRRVMMWETRRYYLEEQLIEEIRCFEEIKPNGQPVSKHFTDLKLRFIYRYEMQHLLEGCGFQIDALYGDFKRGLFRHGGEQIWTCRKGKND